MVGDHVSMIDALRQKTYTREEVIKKMGVPPEKIPDFLALVGDTSDNIPGIRGRRRQDGGEPARAVRHAREPDRARTRSCRGSQIKQPFGDPEQLERIQISRKLVELRRDVPLPCDARGPRRHRVGSAGAAPAVHRARVPGPRRQGQDEDAAGRRRRRRPGAGEHRGRDASTARRTRGSCCAPIAIAELAAAARAAGRIAITVELDPERHRARGPGRGRRSRSPGQPPAYLPLGHRYIGAPAPPPAADLAPLLDVLADPAIAKIVHDAQDGDRARSSTSASTVAGIVEDTMLAAFLLDPTAEAEPGEAVVQRLGGVAAADARDDRRPREDQPRGRRRSSARRRGPARSRTRCLPIADAAAGAARGERPRWRCTATSSCRSRGCSPQIERDRHPHRRRPLQAARRRGRGKLAELERTIYEAAGTSSTSARPSSSASSCSTSSGSTPRACAAPRPAGRPRPTRSRR